MYLENLAVPVCVEGLTCVGTGVGLSNLNNHAIELITVIAKWIID